MANNNVSGKGGEKYPDQGGYGALSKSNAAKQRTPKIKNAADWAKFNAKQRAAEDAYFGG